MRLGNIQVVEFTTPVAPGGCGYAIVLPQLSFLFPEEGPRPSAHQMAVLASGLQSAIDTALASFEMHWRRESKGTLQ